MNLSKLYSMVTSGDMSVSALRYLIECRGECEFLDYKSELQLNNDYSYACLGRDCIAMRNTGGGYIVLGVEDKTWQPIGLKVPFDVDTKQLRDIVRRATGIDLEVDVVCHETFVSGEYRSFALILVRSTSKRHKLRYGPSICSTSFHPNESWGVRNGDIYFRKSDQTVRVSSDAELLQLFDDLREKEELSALENQAEIPSPFEVENGLYRLLPREYEVFIGRDVLREEAKNAIERDLRIWITNLYGPGGVGKSALASWLAYRYYEDRRFDSILQVSAKDTQLTPSGISRLRPTLYSLEGLLDSILMLFGFAECAGDKADLDEKKEVTLTLLTDYSMLLVLDNMETVRDGRIMDFVRDLPDGTQTKVLLTSRLRTSGWEIPVRLNELKEKEVEEFVQTKAKEMRLWPLPNFDRVVQLITQASGGLPLAIQWMLGQYALVGNWSRVTSQVQQNDSPLLEFSFRNSWAVLPKDSREALAVLSIFDEPPTLYMWSVVLGWPTEKLERAAERLIETTFVSRKGDSVTSQETYRALPITLQFARNELAKMGELERLVRTEYQRYVQQMELVAVETDRYSSLFRRFDVERDTEKRAIVLARKAESEAESLNYDLAEDYYKEAMQIDPRSVYVLVNYALLKLVLGQVGEAIGLMDSAAQRCTKSTGFFVHYNFSRVYDSERNRHEVERCLRKALTFEPKHKIARHQLGVVVSRLGRYDEAISIFDELIRDELTQESGPTETLSITYKTKIVSLQKAERHDQARAFAVEAAAELRKWPRLASKAEEPLDCVY